MQTYKPIHEKVQNIQTMKSYCVKLLRNIVHDADYVNCFEHTVQMVRCSSEASMLLDQSQIML